VGYKINKEHISLKK
jgi:translation initiation factor eIF-2B subunit epsilon